MTIQNLRYIVFLIDSKYKEHDGKVFMSYEDAKYFITEAINEDYCDKAIIGMFYNDNTKEMLISKVETVGFTGDKKNINQLELFNI